MKQRMSKKKERLCSDIGGKTYVACYTSGNYGHYIAECWYGEKDATGALYDADWVNYKTREVRPKIRAGQYVSESAG